jgi:Tol biopolymer transport system component
MRLTKGSYKATLAVSGLVASLLMSTNVHAAKNGLIAYPCRTGEASPGNIHQNLCLIDPNEPGATPSDPITSGGDNGLPSWSPDGKILAYTNALNGMATIMVMKVKGVDKSGLPIFFDPQPISPGIAPAWSPDGKEIAFSRPSPTSSAFEIWSMRPDGTDQRQLTDSGLPKRLVTWAPGGQFIAYTQDEFASGHPPPGPVHDSVWVTKLVGNKESHELTVGFCNFYNPGAPPEPCFDNLDADGNVIESQPVLDTGAASWSPTGNNIIFWSGLEGFAGQIWTIASNGKHREQLTLPAKPAAGQPYPNNDDPRWAPDGKKIVFSTNRQGDEIPSPPANCAIQIGQETQLICALMFVMNADGSDQHFIAWNGPGPSFPGNAAWQPVP